MPKHTQDVWDENSNIGVPPANKEFVLGYDSPQQVLLSFEFNGSDTDSHLDPDRPILINGKAVPIPDLPQSKLSLKKIAIQDVDVTKFVKTGTGGQKNLIEVNYIVPRLSLPKAYAQRHVGKLGLSLTVVLPDVAPPPKSPDVEKHSKFCWYCGKTIAAESQFCPFDGQSLINRMGTTPKKCRNCSAALPADAKYCDIEGSLQPTA
jgi:predicted nucleic acid-binding Zn ribbon protein